MKFVHEDEIGYDDNGSGEPIVLLHGFPLDRTMWQAQVAAFSQNYRVICPDLRGHGETTVFGDVSNMSEMAADVARLLDHLEIEQTVLGGLSMGGYVVFEFYKQFPDRVRALVLADTRPGADTEEARLKRYESAEKVVKEGIKVLADDTLPKVLSANTLSDQPEIVERVRQMIESNTAAGAVAALRGMAVRADHTATLSQIDVPTLIVVGEHDALTPPAEAEKMHQAIENSKLVCINNAAHLAPLEQPSAFNSALNEFLKNL